VQSCNWQGADMLTGRDVTCCDWSGSPRGADCVVHWLWTRGPWVHCGQTEGFTLI
jgi:hypothetical protein